MVGGRKHGFPPRLEISFGPETGIKLPLRTKDRRKEARVYWTSSMYSAHSHRPFYSIPKTILWGGIGVDKYICNGLIEEAEHPVPTKEFHSDFAFWSQPDSSTLPCTIPRRVNPAATYRSWHTFQGEGKKVSQQLQEQIKQMLQERVKQNHLRAEGWKRFHSL